MKIRPTLKEVEELAAEGKYKTVPLSCEILSDFITPIEAMRILKNVSSLREPAGRLKGPVTPLFDRKRYCDMVERAKAHIREGDIFQIVLSNRLSAPFEGSLLNAYRVLRTINPSPYMFYLSGTDVEVAGASPETLVRLDGGVLHTFPLAGTRAWATECRSTSTWWRAWSGSTSSREGWTRVTCAPPYAGCRPMPWTSARG